MTQQSLDIYREKFPEAMAAYNRHCRALQGDGPAIAGTAPMHVWLGVMVNFISAYWSQRGEYAQLSFLVGKEETAGLAITGELRRIERTIQAEKQPKQPTLL